MCIRDRYITVQFDVYTCKEHPEWLVLDEKGNPRGTPIFEPGFYRQLCLNSPYRDLIKEMTAEVLETFDADGLFFDIVGARDLSLIHIFLMFNAKCLLCPL